eukprot:5776800-Pyramimonas_sp.AAC.1
MTPVMAQAIKKGALLAGRDRSQHETLVPQLAVGPRVVVSHMREAARLERRHQATTTDSYMTQC